MAKVCGSPFKVDWKNEKAVVAYATRLGKGQTVIYNEDLKSYAITHTERRDRWERPGVRIIKHI